MHRKQGNAREQGRGGGAPGALQPVKGPQWSRYPHCSPCWSRWTCPEGTCTP